MTETSAPKQATGFKAKSVQAKTGSTGSAGAELAGSDHMTATAVSDRPNPASSLTPTDQRAASNEAAVKVLVIDDSETIRRSATSLLEEEGFEVITAEDGFDALSKVVTRQPDIILTDVCMPRLDGYQTCALIKNNAAYSHIPIVMLSSKDSIFDKARGRIVGSEYYITKPFTRKELVQAIHRYTQKSVATSEG